MSKLVQAFLTGVFFTFILDFFLFLGLKLNYIDFYEIDLYYNILFADNQNIYIFSFFSILIGIIITYINKNKVTFPVVGLFFFLVMLTLFEPIGYSLGESMFMKKNINFKSGRHSYNGDVYYIGRKEITFYDYELKKIILLNKEDLIK